MFFASLRWRVGHHGHEWITAKAKDEAEMRWLKECFFVEEHLTHDPQYDLTDRPTLYRIFAETPPTEEGILSFANTCGMLGVKELAWYSEEAQKARAEEARRIRQELGTRAVLLGLDNEHIFGEPLSTWQGEICSMHNAIALWQALRTGDVQWIDAHVIMSVHRDRWTKTPGGDYRFLVDYRFADDPPLPRDYREARVAAWGSATFTFPVPPATAADLVRMQPRPREVIQGGWSLLTNCINQRLSQHTTGGMFYAPGEEPPRRQVTPTNLLGGLWLQLAGDVEGNKIYRACQGGCGKILEIDPLGVDPLGEQYRTNRLYCSDACRSKAYRERQLRAHQLATQGMTVEVIAHTLGTKIERVEGWLAKQPPSREPRRPGRPRKHVTDSTRSAPQASTPG